MNYELFLENNLDLWDITFVINEKLAFVGWPFLCGPLKSTQLRLTLSSNIIKKKEKSKQNTSQPKKVFPNFSGKKEQTQNITQNIRISVIGKL